MPKAISSGMSTKITPAANLVRRPMPRTVGTEANSTRWVFSSRPAPKRRANPAAPWPQANPVSCIWLNTVRSQKVFPWPREALSISLRRTSTTAAPATESRARRADSRTAAVAHSFLRQANRADSSSAGIESPAASWVALSHTSVPPSRVSNCGACTRYSWEANSTLSPARHRVNWSVRP